MTASSASPYSASASDAIHHVLTGPRRAAQVVGAGPHAAYLVVDGGIVIAVVSTSGVRVPCALALTSGTTVPASLRPSATAWAGDHAVGWADATGTGLVRVARWWPAGAVNPGAVDRDRLRRLRSRLSDHELAPGVVAHLRAAAAALAVADQVGASAHLVEVLGLGAGLTPSADDAVAGLLLVSRATLGHTAVAEVGRRVSAAATRRTTTISAALLAHAAQGRAAPQVVAAVDALTGDGRLEPALDALWSLGHSSGADTAAGLLAGAGHRDVRLVA